MMKTKLMLHIVVFALLCTVLSGCAENAVNGEPSSVSSVAVNDVTSTPDEDAKEIAPVTIASGDAEIQPERFFVWSQNYHESEDQWIAADGVDLQSKIKSCLPGQLPDLYTCYEMFLRAPDEYTCRGIRVFSELYDELKFEDNSFDAVNELPVGVWYVAAEMVAKGDYIESYNRYESSCYAYVFKLVRMPLGLYNQSRFYGEVKEVIGDTIMVRAFGGGFEYCSSLYDVYGGKDHEFKMGDFVSIVYDGTILECYPPRPSGLESVELINREHTVISGDIGIKPYFCSVSSKTWEDGGWDSGSGETCDYAMEHNSEKIPELKKQGDVGFYIPEDVTDCALLVFDPETLEPADYPNRDYTVVNKLLKGEYYIVIRMIRQGEFIESEAEHPRSEYSSDEDYYADNAEAFESYTEEYIFKLIIE